MTTSAAVASNPGKPSKPLRSAMARILVRIREAMTLREEVFNSPSHLVRAVCSSVASSVSEPTPVSIPVIVNPTDTAYSTYVAYCKMIGGVCPETHQPLEPRRIELWNSLRNVQRTKLPDTFLPSPTDPTAENPQPNLKRDRVYGIPAKRQSSRCLSCKVVFTLVDLDISEEYKEKQVVVVYCKACATERCLQEPACQQRPVQRPITFDAHVARATRCPSLPKQVEKPISIDMGSLKITPPFAYRTPLVVNALTPRGETEMLPFKSRWCAKCVEYVEQTHAHPVSFDAHVALWPYYKNASGEQNACRVELAVIREREEVRLKRVAEFEKSDYQHKPLWDNSFQGFCEVFKTGPRVHSIRLTAAFIPAPRPMAYEPLERPVFIPRGLRPEAARCIHGLDKGCCVACEELMGHFRLFNVNGEWFHECGCPCGCEGHPVPTIKAAATKQTCKHLPVRSFVFSNWRVIEMCPDCTTFDETRKKVLRQGQLEKVSRAKEALWNRILVEESLSMDRGKRLESGWPQGFPTVALLLNNGGCELCAKCGEVLTTGERVDETRGLYGHPHCTPLPARRGLLVYMGDISYFADAEDGASRSSSGRVNTVGNFDTEKDGSAKDSCSRDSRAKAILSSRQSREPLTRSLCLWCGNVIWANDSEGAKYCSASHRTRFNEEWPALEFEIWLLKKELEAHKETYGNGNLHS